MRKIVRRAFQLIVEPFYPHVQRQVGDGEIQPRFFQRTPPKEHVVLRRAGRYFPFQISHRATGTPMVKKSFH